VIQATRWRQDTRLLPTDPNQRIRFYPTFPSGSGNVDSAFAWSPVLDANQPDGFRIVGSPNGYTDAWGLSGAIGRGLAGLGLSLDVSGLLRGVFALAGIGTGLWLAKKNIEGR
jgi:hypothetical protein